VPELWYYHHAGEQLGPVPLTTLHGLLEAGQVEAGTLVWREGLPDWVELSSLGLLPGRSETAPPPLPPPMPPPAPIRKPAARPADSRAPLYAVLVGIAIFVAAGLGFLGRGLLESRNEVAAVTKKPVRPKPAAVKKEKAVDTGTLAASPTKVAAPIDKPAASSEPDPAGDLTPLPVAPPVTPVVVPLPMPMPAVTAPTTPPSTPLPSTALPSIREKTPNATTPVSQPGTVKLPTLYQELDIQRMPKLGMLGTVTVQDLRYQILSEIKPAPPDDEGSIAVSQVVLDTKLLKSDDLSRAMFQESLAALKGWQFTYKLNSRRMITEWKAAPPDGRKALGLDLKGAKGFLVTSVMDDDGWKELAQLSFFVPPTENDSKSWRRSMQHNFGPLGSWYGETTFAPQAKRDGLEQIGFAHKMEYRPPEKDLGELPFKIEKAMLKPESAGGTLQFDTKAQRVVAAQEAFVVRGGMAVTVLGQGMEVEVEEQQLTTLRLLEQNPWK
jgi:hypothetical protein